MARYRRGKTAKPTGFGCRGSAAASAASDQISAGSDVAAAAEEEAAERGGEEDGLGGVEDVEERVVEEGHHEPRLLLPPPLVGPRALHLHPHAGLEPPERHAFLRFGSAEMDVILSAGGEAYLVLFDVDCGVIDAPIGPGRTDIFEFEILDVGAA